VVRQDLAKRLAVLDFVEPSEMGKRHRRDYGARHILDTGSS
jgi:hypothetical protein